jgi:hypothetical protein
MKVEGSNLVLGAGYMVLGKGEGERMRLGDVAVLPSKNLPVRSGGEGLGVCKSRNNRKLNTLDIETKLRVEDSVFPLLRVTPACRFTSLWLAGTASLVTFYTKHRATSYDPGFVTDKRMTIYGYN